MRFALLSAFLLLNGCQAIKDQQERERELYLCRRDHPIRCEALKEPSRFLWYPKRFFDWLDDLSPSEP